MNPEVQQYIRVFLYTFVIGPLLVKNGIPTSDQIMEPLAGVIIGLANLAWTIYSSRLNGLLARVKASSGVKEVELKVDPEMRSAARINQNTPAGVNATNIIGVVPK